MPVVIGVIMQFVLLEIPLILGDPTRDDTTNSTVIFEKYQEASLAA